MTFNGKVQNGVVVFESPINVPDGTPVTIEVLSMPAHRTPGQDEKMSEEEHRRFLAAMDRIAALPNENPGDTFSGRDHDKVLYGDPMP